MDFERKSDYYSESELGYRVSVAGPPEGRVYSAWHRHTVHAAGYALLGCYRLSSDKESVTAAKQACIDHFNEWEKGNDRRTADT